MTEMVIPGTYIDVRAEGLISAGRVSTGIVAVIGTASRGPVGEPLVLSDLASARDRLGAADPYGQPADGAHPLTLFRALELAYNNGAPDVIAVRVAGASRSSASFGLQNTAGQTTVTLRATTPGSWGNDIKIQSEPAQDDARVEGEAHTSTFDRLGYAPVV